ncbi:hypothetical protein [Proteiniclasticum sp. QWL-01]|uniref:hypothetical protein n=1 Tax=Proteiniclasticum sp. QWL-01 TaxID=3036945 RepID=UPI00220020B9|nr:hypothetical protein [Proteiniclasticum sp. QWL-01]UUM12648.1 hypothetical protein NQU17_03555 [Clostridiaceae bacterium HFYG-1003]WFF74199.1 hypothetical protein P6M73_07060 [Proteiniclasticum sp. QWL-01]
MAEIKRMNSSLAGGSYAASTMDLVIEQERSRRRALRLEAALRKYWVALAALAVVFVILMQSIAIYAMQRNLASVNGEITQLKRTNETLRVTVLKAQDLDQTKQVALAGEYVSRSAQTALSVDLDYNNFTGTAQTADQVSWWGKLFAFFQ